MINSPIDKKERTPNDSLENLENNNDNQPNSEDDEFIMLIMSFGDGQDEQLKIYDKQNPEKDIYDFCVEKHFDYFVLEEIKRQVDQYLKDQHYIKESNSDNNKLSHNINNHKKLSIRIKPNKQNKCKQTHENAGLFPYELSRSSRDINKDFKGFKERKHSATNSVRGNFINISRPLSNSSTRKFPFHGPNLSSCKHSKQNINLKQNQSYTVDNNNNNNNCTNFVNNTNHKNHTIDNGIIQELNPSSIIKAQIVKTSPNKYYFAIPSDKKNSKPIAITKTNRQKKLNHIFLKPRHEIYKITKRKKEEQIHKNDQNKEETNQTTNKEIYTFCPKINKMSKSAQMARVVKGRACTNPTRILNYNKYLQDKFEKFKIKHDNYGKVQDNISNCVFHPKINSNSKYIDDLQNKGSSRFDRLYNYSSVLKQNLEYLKTEEDEKYSYHPHLNEKINNKINSSFQDRLKIYSENLQDKKQKIKDEMNNNNNSFKPNINKNKYYYKLQNSSGNIFDKLYANKNVYKRLNTESPQPKMELQLNHKKNQQILKNKRMKIFQKIFNILDSDGDNQINPRTINFNALPKNIQTILNPIYIELKDDEETLTSKEFIEVCEIMYQNLSLYSKQELMNFNISSLTKEHLNTYIDELKKSNTLTFKQEKYSPKNFEFGLFYNYFMKKLNKVEHNSNSNFRSIHHSEENNNFNNHNNNNNNSEIFDEIDFFIDDVISTCCCSKNN
jgi:hypothetical protein